MKIVQPCKCSYFKLVLVTNKGHAPLDPYLHFVATLAKSGITSVQLREKNLNLEELFEFGKELQSVLRRFSIPLIVNDHIALAYKLNAHGVHLGQTDISVLDARKKLGDDKIIGLSVNSLKELQIANTLPIDYVGIGAIFQTNSKTDVSRIWGLEGLEKIAPFSKHPIVAIGGINENNVEAVMKKDAKGIAAISCFHDAKNPEETTRNLRSIVDEYNVDE